MYTRCPSCSCTFRVTAAILQMAEGDVRCGACSAVFNALQTLVDDPSDASDFTVPGAPKLVHPDLPATAPTPPPSAAPDGTLEFDVPENEWQRFFISPPAKPPPDRVEPALGPAFEAIEAEPEPEPGPDGPAGPPPAAEPVARRTLEEETADTDTWKGFLREAEALAAGPDAGTHAYGDTDDDDDEPVDTDPPFVVAADSPGDAPTVLVRRPSPGAAHAAVEPDRDESADDDDDAHFDDDTGFDVDPDPEDDPDEADDDEVPDLDEAWTAADSDRGADGDTDDAPDDDLDPAPFTPPTANPEHQATAAPALRTDADADADADTDADADADGFDDPDAAANRWEDPDAGDPEETPPEPDRDGDAGPWPDATPAPGLAAAARRPDPGADTVLDWGPPPAFPDRSPRAPAHTGRWLGGSLVAALVLAAQLVHYSRDALAADPSWGPATRSVYARLGMPLNPAWPLEAYEIRGAKAIAENTAPGALDIVAEIAVTGDQPVGAPLVRVVLRDRWSNAVASGVFDARTYLAEAAPATGVYAPGTLIPVAISLADPGAAAQGYEIDVCLPNRQLGLQCRAARDPFRR